MVKKSALQFAKDKIFKVISSLSGGFVKVVILNDSNTTCTISNNAVRPIPITSEILEKNGWDKEEKDGSVFSLSEAFMGGDEDDEDNYTCFQLYYQNKKDGWVIDMRGEPVLYKGKDIGAYVAGYVEEKYIILGFYDDKGCILAFNTDVNVDEVYESYRFAKLKYLEVIKHQ
nr:MAG TPA: hypothetical protein [Bacteriophage sp.]